MCPIRVAATAAVAVLVAGSSVIAAAPSAITGGVPTASLARAVRVNPPPPPPPPSPVSPVAGDILARVNAERAARGLAPMRLDDRLVLLRNDTPRIRHGQVA